MKEAESVWDEPENAEGRVVFSQSGVLTSGTLNQLIIYITTSPESANIIPFVTLYSCFTTFDILLRKLIDRYHVPTSYSQSNPSLATTIQLRCLKCLEYLIIHTDILSDSFTQQLETLEQIDTSFASVINNALQMVCLLPLPPLLFLPLFFSFPPSASLPSSPLLLFPPSLSPFPLLSPFLPRLSNPCLIDLLPSSPPLHSFGQM